MSVLNLKHQLLLAMPGLDDPNFKGSLTYICEHNEDGAMGITINRRLTIPMAEILIQLEIKASQPSLELQPVYYGGPVEPERGFVLHTPPGDWEATLKTDATVGLSSSRDILNAIAQGEGPEKFLLALGYSGWAAGQLETEIAQNAWLSCPAALDILFDLDDEAKLAAAAKQLGVDLSMLSSNAGHA